MVRTGGTGQMIGVEHESQGHYHLLVPSSSIACTNPASPNLLNSCLDHPNISKLKKSILSLSSLSTFNYESYRRDKHAHSSFSSRVNNRTKALFFPSAL